MLMTELDQFHDLSYYTLSHPDKAYFIHQHIVDAFTAQNADEYTKPIALIFSLAGLYLFAERNFSGKQVQLAHMEMAKHKRPWPVLTLPLARGSMTVNEILQAEPGQERDLLIADWCREVWFAYSDEHEKIRSLVPSF
jgi:hypothetical protein